MRRDLPLLKARERCLLRRQRHAIIEVAEEEGVVVEERHRGARLVGQPQVELEVEAADELAQVLVAAVDLGHVRRELTRHARRE